MKSRAAVAFEAGKPLEIVEVDLEGPKSGEILMEVKATGLCHTDEFTRSGNDPEGIFPAILGHEGAGVVLEIGPGVTSVEVGGGSQNAHHTQENLGDICWFCRSGCLMGEERYPEPLH